jgi:mannose/fructose/N-acetylgalactosamine-specific phosphotransferase system component IIB
MAEREKFGKDYVEKEFWKIGLALKIKMKIFLLGGCAMVFRDLKPATKDVDIVFTSPTELKEFVDALKSLNYYEVVKLPKEYEKMRKWERLQFLEIWMNSNATFFTNRFAEDLRFLIG